MTSMIIDPRFCGPKQSANGGYAAGVFAQAIKGPAEVTLKSPPPLGAPIEIRARGDGAVDAVYDDKIIASVRPGEVVIDPPDLPDEAAIDEAHNAYLADRAMTRLYPYCFVCGKER